MNQNVKTQEDLRASRNLFAVKEAYRAIRTNIALSFAKDGCKRIVFTSPVEGEGKTVTSSNVAFSMSQTESKVLLIDADLRRPRVHRVLKLRNEKGLSNVLGRLCGFEDAVTHTKYNNLDVLTAGMKVPNPAEILAGEAMQNLLETLSQCYDYIIIDTPPVNMVSDAYPVIKMTDGVIIVVRQNYSTYPALQKTVDDFKRVDAKILGVVLNSAEGDKVAERGGYNHYAYSDDSTEEDVTV